MKFLVLIRRRHGKAEIVLLDHGLYQEITDKDRVALSHLWKAIVLNDHANMKKYSLQLGVQGDVFLNFYVLMLIFTLF